VSKFLPIIPLWCSVLLVAGVEITLAKVLLVSHQVVRHRRVVRQPLDQVVGGGAPSKASTSGCS